MHFRGSVKHGLRRCCPCGTIGCQDRTMKPKPPPDRRKFANEWDEIDYLYDKLLYWLYQREDAGKANPFAERLERLLPTTSPDHGSIFGEECWSLVHETKGDFASAIKHRNSEIRLIRRLHEIALALPKNEFALQGYGYQDLSDRLDLLAGLYLSSDQLDKAITLLQESKRLCEAHGIPYDGKDLLKECLEEAAMRNGTRTTASARGGKAKAS